MEYPYNTPHQAMNNLFAEMSAVNVWELLMPIDNAHIYRAKVGDYTPTLIKRLQDLAYIPPPVPRVRWSPDCTPELREAIRAECDRLGLTSGEMLKALWLVYLNT